VRATGGPCDYARLSFLCTAADAYCGRTCSLIFCCVTQHLHGFTQPRNVRNKALSPDKVDTLSGTQPRRCSQQSSVSGRRRITGVAGPARSGQCAANSCSSQSLTTAVTETHDLGTIFTPPGLLHSWGGFFLLIPLAWWMRATLPPPMPSGWQQQQLHQYISCVDSDRTHYQ
jgi:hypothetical protein